MADVTRGLAIVGEVTDSRLCTSLAAVSLVWILDHVTNGEAGYYVKLKQTVKRMLNCETCIPRHYM